jgi:DNA-binding NtrC family response regulator
MASESAQKTTRVEMEDIRLAEKSPQWKVIIPPKDQQRVLDRAKKNLALFKDARILWIDDMPDTLRNEYKMLERLRIDIDLATSETEAEHRLQTDKYDLILSDIARGDNRKAGLEFLGKYAKREQRVPFIFYVGVLHPEKGVPGYAFGITHRPDELLHLIMDALERVKS